MKKRDRFVENLRSAFVCFMRLWISFQSTASAASIHLLFCNTSNHYQISIFYERQESQGMRGNGEVSCGILCWGLKLFRKFANKFQIRNNTGGFSWWGERRPRHSFWNDITSFAVFYRERSKGDSWRSHYAIKGTFQTCVQIFWQWLEVRWSSSWPSSR